MTVCTYCEGRKHGWAYRNRGPEFITCPRCKGTGIEPERPKKKRA